MSVKKSHKLLRCCVVFVLTLCVTVTMAPDFLQEADAAQSEENTVERLFGATRYETAFEIADTFLELEGTEKFSTVIVASGTDFSDALAGSCLAVAKNAPILLYKSSQITVLHEYIKENLLPGGTVYVLGGTEAVAADFENGLTGFSIRRLAGTNRFETNLAILKELGTDSKEILVCAGYTFADSLSASAVGKPILLVNTKAGQLTANQKSYLESSDIEQIYIIGGTEAVSTTMEKQLEEYADIKRLGGTTRYETSMLVAEKFFTNPKCAVLAYAWNYPDGLCSGPLANQLNSPVLLSANANTKPAKAYAEEYGIKCGYVIGGSGLVSDESVCDIFGTTPETEKTSEPKVYSITYELDGGNNADANPATYTAGQLLALEAPTKENYLFKGWYLENNFKTKVEQIDATFNRDITLYAKWNLKTLNINGYTTDNMIWSWWYYPQAITAAEDGNNLFWGYTTDEGYCGVAHYDKASGITTKTALKHVAETDDHNVLALTVMEDGRIMCLYSGGHDYDNEVHVRISDEPYDITGFSTDIVLMSAGSTCYGQILQHDGSYYIFYRVIRNCWGW